VKFDLPVLDWMNGVLVEPPFSVQPLTPQIADQSAALSGELLPDPADRLVVGSALVLDCDLITADSKIHASGLVRCIW
jgi:PIN domain nuclease of toxin-antitoxin system